MQTNNLRGKDFITLQEWNRDEIDTLLEIATELKKKYAMGVPAPYLEYKTAMLMFFEESTRTRNSMEAGLAQMGGHANFLDTSTMQVSHGEVAKDTAIILSSYSDAIACRNCDWEVGNKYLREMAEWSSAPILSLQDDLYHPMQGLADLMTIKEKRDRLKKTKVSIIWAFATSHKKPISVPVTQLLLFPRYGMEVTLAHPAGYELPDWVIEQAEKNAEKYNGSVTVTDNQEKAYIDADIVIPKNWGNWSGKMSDEEVNSRQDDYRQWKCTEEMMELAAEDVMYMHALPADRGNEVEDSVIDGPHSIVYEEAENRLHTAKAVMTVTMSGR